MSLEFSRKDILCFLSCFSVALQREGHENDLFYALNRRRPGLSSTFLRNLRLPIFSESVQFWKYRSYTKQVYTFVHSWHFIQVLDRKCLQLLTVNKAVESSVVLWTKATVKSDFICVSSIASTASIGHFSCVWNAPASSPAWYEAECIGRLSHFSSLLRCSTALTDWSCMSDMFLNFVSILITF